MAGTCPCRSWQRQSSPFQAQDEQEDEAYESALYEPGLLEGQQASPSLVKAVIFMMSLHLIMVSPSDGRYFFNYVTLLFLVKGFLTSSARA